MDRKINAILRIIADAKKPIGSAEISQKLKECGIDLSERAVRYHLKIMDQQGLTEIRWKEGRILTEKGREELENAFVSDKVGLVISRIESLAYRMDFDLERKAGSVILNLSFIPKREFRRSLEIMRPVFKKKFNLGSMVAVAGEGEEIGGVAVPAGKVGFGTVCSVTLHGILLKKGVPVESKFSGILQIEKGRPLRFTDLISYSGSTLDPVEIFIRSKMTGVREAVAGSGKIVASFREIPAISRNKAIEILQKSEETGLGSALMMGKPGQPLLEIPVGSERVGLVICAGLNPIAALEEAGIETESKALASLVDYSRLLSMETLNNYH